MLSGAAICPSGQERRSVRTANWRSELRHCFRDLRRRTSEVRRRGSDTPNCCSGQESRSTRTANCCSDLRHCFGDIRRRTSEVRRRGSHTANCCSGQGCRSTRTANCRSGLRRCFCNIRRRVSEGRHRGAGTRICSADRRRRGSRVVPGCIEPLRFWNETLPQRRPAGWGPAARAAKSCSAMSGSRPQHRMALDVEIRCVHLYVGVNRRAAKTAAAT